MRSEREIWSRNGSRRIRASPASLYGIRLISSLSSEYVGPSSIKTIFTPVAGRRRYRASIVGVDVDMLLKG